LHWKMPDVRRSEFLLLVLPFSVMMIVLRYETVFLLFQRGEFGEKATHMTEQVLPYLLAGTFAFAAQTVVVRGYYAVKNTWFPAPVFLLLLTGPGYVFKINEIFVLAGTVRRKLSGSGS
jgi:putative peptidoglycan lipid II flippase